MRRKILYLACLGALALTSCSDNELSPEDNAFPKGELIDVVTTLSTNTPATRAVDKLFEPNDELLAYVQAGRKDGESFIPVTSETGFSGVASIYSKMLTFTMKSNKSDIIHTPEDGNTNMTSSFDAASNYYWDDFSTSDYDLRTSGRGIRLYYGYCYNGGTPTKGLTDDSHTEADGIIEWTVNSDQKTSGTKTSDLLFATTQDMIKYDHNKGQGSQRGTLKIPYTHAMSKFSIEIQCGDGFENVQEPMANTNVTLYNAQLKCTVTAPGTDTDPVKYVVQDDGTGATGNVAMHETGSGTQKVFSAIVAPTTLSVGNILATISDVNGIPYTIYITESLLDNAPAGQTNKWKNELESVDTEENLEEGVAHARPTTRADAQITKGKGYRTKSGVHYHLTVRISKQKIDVLATITDWNDVYGETTGTINFSNDVTDKGTISLADMTTFDVYRSVADSDPSNQSFDGDGSTDDGINPVTTYTYSGSTWSCSPQLYWPNASTEYFFRALSGAVVSSDATTGNITVSNTKAGGINNNDLIWGTTDAHSGTASDGNNYNYAEGDKIKPRTGDVPLTFRHIMSKVRFKLETETRGENGTTHLAADGVNLNGAKIQIDHLATNGNLVLNTGGINTTSFNGTLYDPNTIPALTYSSATLTSESDWQIVLPQNINADAKIIITLADGTTYKAVLKECKVYENGTLTNTPITTWEPGKRYTYTIHLKKDDITFRALVNDWKDAQGSGNATLEWD